MIIVVITRGPGGEKEGECDGESRVFCITLHLTFILGYRSTKAVPQFPAFV